MSTKWGWFTRQDPRRLPARNLGRRLIEPLEGRLLLTTHYVDLNAPGPAHDGTTWDTAYLDLQLALAAATAGDEIHVADGVYKPTSGTDRTTTFALKNGIVLAGGYAGSGAIDPDQRDVVAFETILSGDLGAQNDWTDNTYHVVTTGGTTSATILDGVTIYNGYADGSGEYANGGGIYNNGGSPSIINCTIKLNTATGLGAGMYNTSAAAPTLQNCAFLGNQASVTGARGGGMYDDGSSLTLENCRFEGNSAYTGAAIYHSAGSNAVVRTSTFKSNSAGIGGGSVYNSGSSLTVSDCTFERNTDGQLAPIYNVSASAGFFNCSFLSNLGGAIRNVTSTVALTNCIFAGNYANSALFNSGSAVTLTNCSLAGNKSFMGGGAISNVNSLASLMNCVVWGNTAPSSVQISGSAVTLAYCIIQGGWSGTGNMDADPQFVRNPSIGPDGIWITSDDDPGDLRLQAGSPCLDAGNNAAVPFGVLVDFDGNPRFSDIAGANDPGSIVDIGAYERQGVATFSAVNGTLLYAAGHQLRVGFSNAPDAATVQETDLTILNLDTLASVTFSAVTGTDSASQSATWSLTSTLPDGNYRATLAAGSVGDLAASPLSPSFYFDFFVLAGDANRDRKVDLYDLTILATNWQGTGRTFSQGDFDYNGVVNSADLAILATHWQTRLDPPPQPAPPVPTSVARRAPVRTPTRISETIL